MSRNVEFKDQEMKLQLTGLLSIAALKREVVIPYHTITKVHIGTFDAPFWMLKMPGTVIPGLHIYEGSFLYNKEWYFLSYEKRGPHIIVELNEHKHYHYVIFDIADAEQMVVDISSRCPQLKVEL